MDRSLRSGGRSATDGPAARRLRRALVAAQFALATPLIVAAALVVTSLDRLSRVSVGIETERRSSRPPCRCQRPSYARESDRKAFWDRSLARVMAAAGVQAAAAGRQPATERGGAEQQLRSRRSSDARRQNQPICTWVGVSPSFFSTVGLRLERGRLLDERSLQDDVVVVDRAWATGSFPGQEVSGRRFRNGGCTTCPWTTVVGVVGNVKWVGIETNRIEGTVYFPFVDMPNAYFVVRATDDPASLTTALRAAVRELDPGLAPSPASRPATISSRESLAAPRYLSVLVGMFALSALLLSVVGIYGVMTHFVQQHTRDIGIRLALGGEPWNVRRMIVLQGLRLVVVGVCVGVGIALVGSRLLTTVRFGVSPTDLRTMASVPIVLVMLAALACLAPGRRAAKLDPAEILRES